MEYKNEFVERKIVVGVITSTEYLQQIHSIWNIAYIEAIPAKKICTWAVSYFEKYGKAINKGMYDLFLERSSQLSREDALDIENILDGINYDITQEREDSFNLDYLVDLTKKHFNECILKLLAQNIQTLLDKGDINSAVEIASNYTPLIHNSETSINLGSNEVLNRIDKAFDITNKSIINFPRQLGIFWESQFVRDSFVAFMGSEKKGKSFWLLDIAMRACTQKRKVVFFQAGDMSENQQIKRICVYLAQKSDQQRYCEEMVEPVRDCVYNQLNKCKKDERACDFGVIEFLSKSDKYLREEIDIKQLTTAFDNEENKDYRPCSNCEEYNTKHFGTPWLKRIKATKALDVEEAKEKVESFFIKNKKHFKLSTHINKSLSVKQIKASLALWEKQEGFVPDVIIIDYADLLVPETKEFRHGQNEIWMGLRSLSQEKHCLVVTATQADAKSYDKDLLSMSNFSEDKRKYAHVTAMYGLNQDSGDREKKLGLMRINELVIREGSFSNRNVVYVLQNLRRGKPFLGSYF